MNNNFILFIIYQISLLVLTIILLLDIVRISTFLFYEKEKKYLNKKLMVVPFIGKKFFSVKNILATCLLFPTMVLLYVFKSMKNIFFYYILFIFLTLIFIGIAFLNKKVQIDNLHRKKAKQVLILEILVLILLFILILNPLIDIESMIN